MTIAQNITIRIIPHGSTEYHQTIILRDRLLRAPLGLCFSDEEIAEEIDSIHIAAFQDDLLLGCLVMKPVSEHEIKIRQVVVVETEQGKGIGSAMTVFAEQAARTRGYTTVILHARKHAVPFYLKHGYRTEGEQFIEVTIPHYRMVKEINL